MEMGAGLSSPTPIGVVVRCYYVTGTVTWSD